MIDPALQSYIDTSLAAGFSRDQIEQTLLQSGWDPDSVAEALPSPITIESITPAAAPEPPASAPLGITPATGAPNRRRKVIRVTALSILVVVLLCGSTVTLAEFGYLPSVSRVYRKTLAPLIWKGTTANPDATIAQMAKAMSTVTTLHEESSLTVSARVANPQASVSLEKWPKLASYLAFASKKDARTFADVATFTDSGTSDFTTQPVSPYPMGFDPASLLPAKVSLTSTMDIDDKQNFHLKIGTDLGDLVDKLGSLSSVVPTLSRTSDNEAMIIRDSKKAFVKSPLIPYLSPEDTGKFLFFNLPDSYIDELKKQDQLPDSYEKEKSGLKKEELDAWNAIASVIWKDKGVERRNGTPYAHYEISLNPSIAQEIDKLPKVAACKCTVDIKSIIDSKSSVTINMYVEQRTQRLGSLDLTLESTPMDSNVTINASFKLNLAYVLPAPIASPDSSQVIEEEGNSYLNKITQGLMSGFGSDSLGLETSQTKVRNTERKSMVTELAKSLEMHKYEDGNSTMSVPSTNGVAVRLDNPMNVLAENQGMFQGITFPLLDPVPDKYYYSYTSDGTSYTVSCIVTSDTDPTAIVGLYRVRDGVSEEVPYP